MSYTKHSLGNFDMNLLRPLSVLLQVKHVSQAADCLNVTQSAMSKNLSRLRFHFNDELLVRVGNQMVLTPKAEALIPAVNELFGTIDSMLQKEAFNPKTQPMTFTLAAMDFLMQLYFPRFLESLLIQAPLIKLNLVSWSTNTIKELADGRVDFMLGGLHDAPAGIYRQVLDKSHYVLLARKHHPLFNNNRFDLEAYLEAKHISISLLGTGANPVDTWLAKQGLERNVAVTTPNFMSAIAMVSESELVVVAHAGIAKLAQRYYDFDIHDLPVKPDMPPFGIFWHERTHRSEQHRWFRQQIFESVSLFQ